MEECRAWIARDKEYNSLFVYKYKPIRREKVFENDPIEDLDDIMILPSSWYPEVTWENSPKELIVKE